MRTLDRKLRRDLASRRGQFIAVVVTIVLGIALFGGSYDAFLNLQASYDHLFDVLNAADMTVTGGDIDAIAAEVRQISGVDAVGTRTVADVPVRIDGHHKMLGRLVGMPTGEQPPVDQVMVLDGSYLSSPTQVLVEQHMGRHFGLEPGDTIEVLGPTGWFQVPVAGIAASAEYLWPAPSRQQIIPSFDDFGVLFAPEQALAGVPAAVAQRQVLIHYRSDVDRLALDEQVRQIAVQHGALDATTLADLPSNAALSEDLAGFQEMSVMFPMLFLAAAGMATYVLLTRLVLSQRGQIGLLMASGFSKRDVFGHYLRFGLLAGGLGAVIGAPLGLLLGGEISRLYTGAIDIPVTVIHVRASTLAIGIAFGIVAGAVSALAPAMRAAKISPATAMRGFVPPGKGRMSLAERVIPPIRRLPARWKMVIRGVGRNRNRTISTVVGVVLAVTLVLTFWAMIDSIQVLLDRQFHQVNRQDALLYLTVPVSPTILDEIMGLDGVAAAEPVADLPATVISTADQYHTELVAFDPNTQMHRFVIDGDVTRLPDDAVYLGDSLRDLLDVSVGDSVTIGTDTGSFTLPVAGFVHEPLGTFAYVSRSRLAAELGVDDVANTVYVRFAPGVDREVMRDRIGELSYVGAFVDARALEAMADQYMGLFYVFIGVMLALGGVMAFALIYNTISANIAERSSEIAMMRAGGVARWTISRLITGENILLTLIGVVPGLVFGYVFALEGLATYSSDLFKWDLYIRPTTYVFTVVAVLVAAFFSQRPILKAVQQIDIATVVRERSL